MSKRGNPMDRIAVAQDFPETIEIEPVARAIPIVGCEMSVRVSNALRATYLNGGYVRTLGDLHGLPWVKVAHWPNIGRRAMVELKHIVDEANAA